MLSPQARPQEPIDLSQYERRLDAVPYQGTGHRGISVAHHEDLRLVLIGLAEGGKIERHTAEGRVMMQVLSGQVRVRTDAGSSTLSAGQMVVLDPRAPHEIEGLYESKLLLAVVPAWEH